MNCRRVAIALVSAAVLCGAAGAQTPTPGPGSRSGASGASPTPTDPVPDWVMTPGASALTPGAGKSPAANTTPGYGGNIFGLPPTTPSGMPAYTLTSRPSGTPTTPTGRPRSAAECGSGRWRTYGLGFVDEKSCADWVRSHPDATGSMGAPGAGTPGAATSSPAATATPTPNPTPRPRRGPPTPAATPGLSMKPPATPIPILRAR